MKDPYGKLLESKKSFFNKLGFFNSIDDEYVAIFSKNGCSIEISVERYYLPSITTKFIDCEGNIYSMRIIREILDLKNLEKDMDDLDEIKSRYQLNDERADEAMRRKGVEEYVKLSIEQLLCFLSKFSDTLIVVDDGFRRKYQKRDRELLGRLGL
jgi:hypothetical protein